MRVVLASSNKGKAVEFNQLLVNSNIKVVPQSDFNVSSVEETGTTFVENAIIKARHAATETGLPAIADDSGLVVDALGGYPGVISSRYSGEDATDKSNIALVLQQLKDVPEEKRNAHFQCLLVFMRNATDPSPIICEGTWEGIILFEPTGKQGFGYDPIFYDPEQQCSAAELLPEVKNKISHRGQALQQMLVALRELGWPE